MQGLFIKQKKSPALLRPWGEQSKNGYNAFDNTKREQKRAEQTRKQNEKQYMVSFGENKNGFSILLIQWKFNCEAYLEWDALDIHKMFFTNNHSTKECYVTKPSSKNIPFVIAPAPGKPNDE